MSIENEKHYIYNKATKKMVSSHPNKKEAYHALIHDHHFDKDMTVLHPSEFHIYGVKLKESFSFSEFVSTYITEHKEESVIETTDTPVDVEEVVDESIEHEYIQSELSHKDINSKIENGKVVVHKSNVAKAKTHLNKLGYKHEVIAGLNEDSKKSFKDFLTK